MRIVEQLRKPKSIDNHLSMVNFHRRELEPILKIYGQMVSSGDCRDYSISSSFSSAIFSVFRRSTETPLYMIVKTPKLSKRGGMYSVIAMNGQIIKQGKDLNRVLQILNKKLFKIV